MGEATRRCAQTWAMDGRGGLQVCFLTRRAILFTVWLILSGAAAVTCARGRIRRAAVGSRERWRPRHVNSRGPVIDRRVTRGTRGQRGATASAASSPNAEITTHRRKQQISIETFANQLLNRASRPKRKFKLELIRAAIGDQVHGRRSLTSRTHRRDSGRPRRRAPRRRRRRPPGA